MHLKPRKQKWRHKSLWFNYKITSDNVYAKKSFVSMIAGGQNEISVRKKLNEKKLIYHNLNCLADHFILFCFQKFIYHADKFSGRKRNTNSN